MSILGFPFITFEEGIFRHSTALPCLAAANVFVSEALIYARHFGYASLPPSPTTVKAVPLAASADAGLSLRSYPSMMRRPNSPQRREGRKGAGTALASAVALTQQNHAENELMACSEWSVRPSTNYSSMKCWSNSSLIPLFRKTEIRSCIA